MTDVLPDGSIEAAFREFDAAHPEVYGHFRALATRARWVRRHYGAKAILEVVRWELAIDPKRVAEADDFKINNNFTSRYARKLIAEDPSFDGFFELRALHRA